MKKTYAVISHTHWDREWYQPFELFRFRLVDMMDNLLKIMKDSPTYFFHLDAQTIVLEDYLEIRPEKRKLLEKYIKEGRLLVGPWYVQNDFFLTSGEATIRNLIIGQKIADEFGKCTRIAYMADQFGLTSQLPQIFRQIGIDCCAFGRGANAPDTPAQFNWKGADGSVVLCEFMKWWYNNLQRVPDDTEQATKLIKTKAEIMSAYMKTSNYLLMNGVDHLEAQENLLPILDKVRENLPGDITLIQDTMPEFFERTKKELREKNILLTQLNGELRMGGENTVLTGTLSSRIYLKIANVKAQVALEKRVEPLYTILSSLGITEYPFGYLNYIWKLLIKNHPHDSICGCSVDSVHRHMMDRYERIQENTDELIRRGMQAISDHVDRKNLTEKDYILTVLNTVSFKGKTVIDAEIMLSNDDKISCFKILDPKGREIPFTVYAISHKGHSTISPVNLPGDLSVTRYNIRFILPIDSIGFNTLTVRPCQGLLKIDINENAKADLLENRFVRCKINTNGTITVTNKITGKIYDNLLIMEDCEEIGDEYVHRESENSKKFTSDFVTSNISVIEDNKFMQRRNVTYEMTVDRNDEKRIPFDITISLSSVSSVIDIDLSFMNTAKNHRIRVLFPTEISSDEICAASPFDLIKRSIYRNDNDKRCPNSGFFAVSDGKNGFAVLNEGLYEYEHLNDPHNTLALTLLRANESIAWYKDQKNIAKEWHSPQAQCFGENKAHFGICLFEGNVESANVSSITELFLAAPITHCAPTDMRKMLSGRPFVQSADIGGCVFFRKPENADKKFSRHLNFVQINNSENNIMISACKKSENGKGNVIRLFNPTENSADFILVLNKKIKSASVISPDERTVIRENIPTDGNKIPISLNAKKIITLFIK